MWHNPICNRIASGGKIVNGWCSLPSAGVVEVLARQGYDSLTIDMQHGGMGFETVVDMLRAMAGSPVAPLVRVPWHDPGTMMRVLDAGAFGIICPMVDSAASAEAFVAACRYPPRGFRSFGPHRAVIATGTASSAEYVRSAAADIMLLAMIETTSGLAAVEDIVAVDGLDGVYVGPGDLSLALGEVPSMAPTATVVTEAIALVLAAAKKAGRIVAIHTDGPATARRCFAAGFDMCTLQGDIRLLSDAARSQVLAVRAAGEPYT
ncbi:MAG: aldolase/citrate lyase family protein [Hyphomicrobiaceae bacterium]|nr:aldolase/citrate lyase family protein [Hyphomicrobiaceae bacterium]